MTDRVLHIGLHGANNLGDQAIAEVIYNRLGKDTVSVNKLNFNFRAVLNAVNERKKETNFSFDVTKKGSLIRGVIKDLKQFTLCIALYPLMFFYFLKASKGCKKVYMGGGNIMMGMDYVFPLQAFFYCLAAKLTGKEMNIVFVGVGPFNKRFTKTLIELCFRMANKVGVRDEFSIEQCLKLKIPKAKLQLLPDPVLSWYSGEERANLAAKSNERQNFDVIISVMPLSSSKINKSAVNQKNAFLEDLCKAINYFRARNLSLALLVTDTKIDFTFASELKLRISEEHDIDLPILAPKSVTEMFNYIQMTKTLIATRMHSAIFAMASGIRVINFDWQCKIRGVYRLVEIDDYLVQVDSLGGFEVNELINAFEKLEANGTLVHGKVEKALKNISNTHEIFWGQEIEQ